MAKKVDADDLLKRVAQSGATGKQEQAGKAAPSAKSAPALEQKGENLFNKALDWTRNKGWPFLKAAATVVVTAKLAIALTPLVVANAVTAACVAGLGYGVMWVANKPFGRNPNKMLVNTAKYIGKSYGTVVTTLLPFLKGIDNVLRKKRDNDAPGAGTPSSDKDQGSTFKGDSSIKNGFGLSAGAGAQNDNTAAYTARPGTRFDAKM